MSVHKMNISKVHKPESLLKRETKIVTTCFIVHGIMLLYNKFPILILSQRDSINKYMGGLESRILGSNKPYIFIHVLWINAPPEFPSYGAKCEK